MADHSAVFESAALLKRRIASLTLPLESADRYELQGATCAYVDVLKGLGWSSERIIVNVLQIAREAGLGASHWTVLSDGTNSRDNLLVDMVGWCLEQYRGPEASA